MSSIIDDIFDKRNLVPALVIGVVIILICLAPKLFFWFMVILALFVIIIGLLIFLKDRNDFMPAIVMVVGIIALVLLIARDQGWLS